MIEKRNWRDIAIVASGLLGLLWATSLAGAACPSPPVPPCSHMVTGAFERHPPILGCVRNLPICGERSTTRNRPGGRAETGATGRTGARGMPGSPGMAGPQGPSGSPGGVGPTGAPGAQGNQGNAGLTGPQGVAGPAGPGGGATGPQGVQGIQGIQGVMGALGLTGAQGLTGAAGALGLQGIQGLVGPDGARGLQGSAGTPGIPGVDGAAGLAGATGPAGPSGAAGAQGLPGTPGTQGPTGVAGAIGADGPQGPAGATGTSGLSQYAYVYNTAAETVALDAAVTFSSNGRMTAGITHALGGAGITLLNAGDYMISFSVSATESSQISIFIDGVPVAGTTYGSGAGTQQNMGQVMLAIAAGEVLTIRNHSSAAAIGLAALVGGTQATTNASVTIEKLA